MVSKRILEGGRHLLLFRVLSWEARREPLTPVPVAGAIVAGPLCWPAWPPKEPWFPDVESLAGLVFWSLMMAAAV